MGATLCALNFWAFPASAPASRSWNWKPTLSVSCYARWSSGLVEAGRLHSSCRANLNGDAFVSDPRTRLSAGDCVLILSADAGG